MWGWATWRRSVEFFDPNMPSWPKVSADGLLETIFETPTEVQYWKSVFDRVHQGKLDSWGYGWFFSSLIQNQFNIMPVGNLVSNIGYVQNATHTQDTTSHLSNLSVTAAKFPLRHPLVVSHHQKFDKLIKEDVYHIGRPFLKRLFQKLNRIFRQYQPKLG